MKMTRPLVAALLLFSGASCGVAHAQFGGGVAMPGLTTATTDAAGSAWTEYKGDLQRTSSVDIKLGVAPNLLWRYSSDLVAKEFDSTPLVIGNGDQRRIYFAADRYVVCLEAMTGSQVWRSKPLQRPVTSPLILIPAARSGADGDVLLAVTSSGQLNALRTLDGGQAWQIPAVAPIQNIAPVIVKTANGERIIVALATGRLVAYTLKGDLDPEWEVRLGSFAATPTATPSISPDGAYLYIPTQDKKMYVVDLMASKVFYSIVLDSGAFSSPAILDEQMFLVTGTTLQGMKLRTGQTQWRFDVKTSFGAPAVKAGLNGDDALVYVGSKNGKFYAVNAATGARAWETDLADSVTGNPIVTSDMILVGTRNGLFFGLAPATGKVLWRYRLYSQRLLVTTYDGGRDDDNNNNGGGGGTDAVTTRTVMHTYGVSSTPAILSDAVYLLGDNACIYAFGLAPFDADPPQVQNPMLSIPNSANKPAMMRLDADKPLLVPGRTPVQLVAEIRDVGSGVDPDSIEVFLKGNPIPRSSLAPFADATGRLLVTLAEPKGKATLILEDGLFDVEIRASDYRGNKMVYKCNFLVDNTVPPPAAPVRNDDDNDR